MRKQRYTKITNAKKKHSPTQRNEEEMMQRLTDIALDFNSGKGYNQLANVEPIVPTDIITHVT